MRRFFWPLLFCSAPAIAGCGPVVTAPAPPVDATPPATLETATFALG